MTPLATLKNLGCKVVSCENTNGAKKWWLTYPLTADSLVAARREVLSKLGLCSCTSCLLDIPEPTRKGFRISWQTQADDSFSGIFLAQHKKTKAGKEYAHGIDC